MYDSYIIDSNPVACWSFTSFTFDICHVVMLMIGRLVISVCIIAVF